MPTVFIGVGSNLGERKAHFDLAQKALLESGVIRGLKCSPVYETEPVESEGGKYLNAVWSFETDLGPRKILELLQGIQAMSGRPLGKPRRRAEDQKNKLQEARTLDLDLLFYGDEVIHDEGLTVPHPRIVERAFVLVPFCDLAPEFIHPIFKETMKQLLAKLNGQYGVRRQAYGENLSPHTVPRTKKS